MSQYFPEEHECFNVDISVKLDLCHYSTKPYLKKATGAYTSNLAARLYLASLK